MSNNIQLHKNDLPDDLDLGNLIAVDGEFMGLNVRRDPLCLIQLSSGNSDAHIIQFDRENYNAPNLMKLLVDDKITKIFHYGRADMAHIKYYLKTDTNNIFDTKIASKLARSYSDSHSLKTLIKEFININHSLLKTNNIKEFEKYLSRHEFLISNLIGLKPVKEKLFKDYEKGIVKSLGAWGGDFVLVTGTKADMQYFTKKGYKIIFNYPQLIK